MNGFLGEYLNIYGFFIFFFYFYFKSRTICSSSLLFIDMWCWSCDYNGPHPAFKLSKAATIPFLSLFFVCLYVCLFVCFFLWIRRDVVSHSSSVKLHMSNMDVGVGHGVIFGLETAMSYNGACVHELEWLQPLAQCFISPHASQMPGTQTWINE